MNKLKLGVIFVVCLLAISGIAMAQGPSTQDTNTRYLIKSDSGLLKAALGVNHKFDNGFTTELTKGQLKALDKLGVETEKVEIYHITARPFCGDGKCHPVRENVETCPEDCSISVPICGDGVCEGDETPATCPEDCSLPEPCLPDNQIPWGIEKVNGGSGGTGITVAVLDTGIDTDHPDLVANTIVCVGIGYATCEDDNGHGTHVAGTIAANGNIIGVAPEANLMAVKVLDKRGRGYTDDIAAGMRYAVDNGANIISMSLGGGESSLINSAVTYANDNDVLVVASAGNSGPTEGSIGYPAAKSGVVAVAAFDSSDNIIDWSSRGVNDGNWIIEEREIEFAAPGVAIESTYKDGCYTYMQGTSMAAPHVTGIAARDWKGTAGTTRTYLQGLAEDYTNSALDYGQAGDDIEAGFGLPIVQ